MKKQFFLSFLMYNALLCGKLNEAVDFDPKNVEFQKAVGFNEAQLTPVLEFLKHEEDTCSWKSEYHIITDLIKSMGLNIGCEVGVAYGLQSKYFLENTSIERLYSVDPYRHFQDYDDFMNFKQNYFDVLYYRVKSRLAEFGERSVLLRKTSVEAAEMFEDNSLDFVYIDANHSYKAVTADLKAWVPKVRSGGLVSGDDYVVFKTTARAVNRFVKDNNVQLYTSLNKWWFIKP